MNAPRETRVAPSQPATALYTVSEAVQCVKEALERDPRLADLWVTGEVSNFRKAASGHNYFTLKDAQGPAPKRSVPLRARRRLAG